MNAKRNTISPSQGLRGSRRQQGDGSATQIGVAVPRLRSTFRERLLAVMDGHGIPEQARLSHLRAVTGRVPQSSRKWIDALDPGLPDLEAFAQLCTGFDVDANSLLGLERSSASAETPGVVKAVGAGAPTDRDWILTIVQEIFERVKGCVPRPMNGDEMAPAIHDGDMMFVDERAREVSGNGIYVLECNGRMMVRHIEVGLEGLSLTCVNCRYGGMVIKSLAAERKVGLKVLGKVRCALSLSRLW